MRMIPKDEHIAAEMAIRKKRREYEYNSKVAALLLGDEKKKQYEKQQEIKRKKTDDALLIAFRNGILIAGLCIIWDVVTNGFRWTWY
jgi:hypothetical protein